MLQAGLKPIDGGFRFISDDPAALRLVDSFFGPSTCCGHRMIMHTFGRQKIIKRMSGIHVLWENSKSITCLKANI
jgi:hypothetical protein